MSDQVIIAIVTAITSLASLVITLFVKKDVNKVKEQTNGMQKIMMDQSFSDGKDFQKKIDNK